MLSRYRIFRLPAAAALLCAALAGCTAGLPAAGGMGGGHPGGAGGAGTAGAAPPPGNGGNRTASLPQTAAPAPTITVNADPARLDGLDRAGLVALLGNPSFQRVDGPALLLRYRHARCILDVFLYAPRREKGKPRRVDYVEARDAVGAAMPTRSCFAALLRARAAKRPAGGGSSG